MQIAPPTCMHPFPDAPPSSDTAWNGIPLTAQEAGDGAQFGFSLAAGGSLLAVGAKADVSRGIATGSVQVFATSSGRCGWRQQALIAPEDGTAGMEFGESVALSGRRLLVGARSAADSRGRPTGAAYLFRREERGWTLEAVLRPPDGRSGDEFGRTVALSGNRLFIGARFAGGAVSGENGAVYVFGLRDGQWSMQQKLSDPFGEGRDEFGRALCIGPENSCLAVGSRRACSRRGVKTGAVLLFQEVAGQWRLRQRIVPADGCDGAYFGHSVAMARNLLVVGARNATDAGGIDGGAAYILRRMSRNGGYLLEERLLPPAQQARAQFGFAVALDAGTAATVAVSARRSDSSAGSGTGAVFRYHYDRQRRSWQYAAALPLPLLRSGDQFGQSLALDPNGGTWLAVGADRSSLAGPARSGAVFLCSAVS